MNVVRTQLSLYAPGPAAISIEEIRRVVDPVQFRLIPAHVTLCREDELTDLPAVRARLLDNRFAPLTLRFGGVEVFDGHGLLLHCREGEAAFHALREAVLGTTGIRAHRPHITLAHPRNPKAAGNSYETATQLPNPLDITFSTVFLIEQTDGGPWNVLERFPLRG